MSEYHYRADGGFDMRYSSSKAACSMGLCNSRGFSNSSYSYSCSPSISSSSSSGYHYRQDGGLDMRYSSSKTACASGLCDNKGNMYSSSNSKSESSTNVKSETKPVEVKSEKNPSVGQKSPKEIERSDLGRTKYGSKEDGTNASHIMSYRVINAILSTQPGRPMSEENKKNIIRQLNDKGNLRNKSRAGNMYGNDGYSGDEYFDQQIEDVIRGNKDRLTNQRCVDRLQRQWARVQQSNIPTNVKEAIRESFSKIHDQDGHVIIRSNAPLN